MHTSNITIYTLLELIPSLLLEENIALRDSLQRVDALLKHAVILMDESLLNDTCHKKTIQDQNIFNKELGNAIRLLQVEDIVSQIICHEINRSLELDKVMIDIKILAKEENGAPTVEDLQRTINQIKSLLSPHNHSTVQNSLNAGDIEIF